MELEWRIAVLVLALAAAGIGWRLLQRSRGVLRPAARAGGVPADVAHLAGERLTLVQVSSEHCSSCARGARVWREVAHHEPDVAFVEIDADDHMDLVRELGILTTPTTLVYDGGGQLRGRVTGAPTPRAARAALEREDGVVT